MCLTGIDSIKKLHSALRSQGVLSMPDVSVLILHGSLSTEQQQLVFKSAAVGEWKIILATNIGILSYSP